MLVHDAGPMETSILFVVAAATTAAVDHFVTVLSDYMILFRNVLFFYCFLFVSLECVIMHACMHTLSCTVSVDVHRWRFIVHLLKS